MFDSDTADAVIVLGGIPAVLVAALLGALDASPRPRSVQLRVAVLALPAMSVVVGVAVAFHMSELIPAASIPTVSAALLLEQWTRRPAPPPIPVATAREVYGYVALPARAAAPL